MSTLVNLIDFTNECNNCSENEKNERNIHNHHYLISLLKQKLRKPARVPYSLQFKKDEFSITKEFLQAEYLSAYDVKVSYKYKLIVVAGSTLLFFIDYRTRKLIKSVDIGDSINDFCIDESNNSNTNDYIYIVGSSLRKFDFEKLVNSNEEANKSLIWNGQQLSNSWQAATSKN